MGNVGFHIKTYVKKDRLLAIGKKKVENMDYRHLKKRFERTRGTTPSLLNRMFYYHYYKK